MTSGAIGHDERARTQRQLLLPEFGDVTQQRLLDCKVAIVGAGGLGSPVIAYLAAAGVGSLIVIDDDLVQLDNLHRQIIHSIDALDTPKTASASRIAAQLAPRCTVTEVRERLTEENALELLQGADIIVDGSDSFDTRFNIHSAASSLQLPVVWGAVLRWDAQVTVFWPNPPSDSGIRPVALTDVFADASETRAAVGCDIAGVIGPLCGQAGSMMALEVIKLWTGVGRPLLGRMAMLNALTGETRTVRIRPGGDPDSASITPHPRPLSHIPDSAIVLDVRRDAERTESPELPGSLHLPLDRVLQLTTESSDWQPVFGSASSQQPLLVVCTTGQRSLRAARHLMSQGVESVCYLDGGLQ